MPKLNELFTAPGAVVAGVFADLKPGVQTTYGPKNVVTINVSGVGYELWLDDKGYQTKFTSNGINLGDAVEITQGTAKPGQNPPYLVRRTGVGALTAVGAPATQTNSPTVTALVADRSHQEEVKQNRISIAGYLQALIVRKEHEVEACKQLALELVQWSKKEAEAMYETEKAVRDKDPFAV